MIASDMCLHKYLEIVADKTQKIVTSLDKSRKC